MQIDNELCENNDEKLLVGEINCILPFPLLLSIIINPFSQVPFWERNAANKNSAETGGNLQHSRVELSLIDYEWNLVRWGSLMPSPLLSSHTCGSCYCHTYSLFICLSTQFANEESVQGVWAWWIRVPFSPVCEFLILGDLWRYILSGYVKSFFIKFKKLSYCWY